MKKPKLHIFLIIILTVITLFISIEKQPVSEVSSSVYQTSKRTEIHINAIVNTFFRVNEEKISKEIIMEHQKINGVKDEMLYILSLYRTRLHYRKNWKCDTTICDKNGAIICCETK